VALQRGQDRGTFRGPEAPISPTRGTTPAVLTDIDCRRATCPPDRPRLRLADSGGLYLEVAPGGSKRWFWKFYPDGKESRLALGRYPEVSLKAARLARDQARLQRKAGQNPVQERRAARLASAAAPGDTFEAVAREFHQRQAAGWSPKYAARWIERMQKDLFPYLGALALPSVTAPVLLGALRRVEGRGATEAAHTLRQTAGQVLRYGVQTGRIDRNPAADLAGALTPVRVKHMAAITTPEGAAGLMRAMLAYPGQPVTRAALLLSALLFQRPGNMRTMQWAELDLDGALWTIPAAKMKRPMHGKINGRPHLVPLPTQAVEILRELHPLTGGRPNPHVFPATVGNGRAMSENTVLGALRRLGFGADEMTPHGFRAMARTLIVEQLGGVHPDVIEAQLAHAKSGPLGAAYDRAEFMTERRRLMQRWADWLWAQGAPVSG
jgi:integrase